MRFGRPKQKAEALAGGSRRGAPWGGGIGTALYRGRRGTLRARVVGADSARGGTVHFLFPCGQRGGASVLQPAARPPVPATAEGGREEGGHGRAVRHGRGGGFRDGGLCVGGHPGGRDG